LVGAADAMALRAAAGHGSVAFEIDERVRRAFAGPRVVFLGKGDLLFSQPAFAIHRRPGGRRVPSAQKLLIDRLVAVAAIAGRQSRGDDEAVMVDLRLIGGLLMTIEAVHVFLGMYAQLVFVNDGDRLPGVPLGALAGGPP